MGTEGTRPAGTVRRFTDRAVQLLHRHHSLELLILLGAGLVTVLWLRGGILFFWDAIVPFRASSAEYYYAFTWQQLFGSGVPGAPFEYGSYFPTMVLLQFVGFGVAADQQILFYVLFASSGLSMYLLLTLLNRQPYLAQLGVRALPGALFYMFNFYVALYLLSDFFESWFLYAFLPLAIFVLLKGSDAARAGRRSWPHCIAFALLVQVMSAGFWEPPYLVYTFLLCAVLYWIYSWSRPRQTRTQLRPEFGFVAGVLVATIVSSLWWLYSYFTFVRLTSSSGSTTATNIYGSVQASFGSPSGDPFVHLMNVLAVYPTPLPAFSNTYSWLPVYLNPGVDTPFLVAGIILVLTIWLPLLLSPRRNGARRPLFPLYGAILLLVFFALQGDNPVLRGLFGVASPVLGSRLGILYATNLQFVMLPLVFLYAIAFAIGIAAIPEAVGVATRELRRWRLLDVEPTDSAPMTTPPARRWHLPSRATPSAVVTIAVVAICVVGYPWYLWSPDGVQEYPTGNGNQVIPSVIPNPPAFNELSDYLEAVDQGYPVLTLPFGFNFLTADVENTSFADTGPVGLVTGTPAVYGNWGGTPSSLYLEINDLIYRPNLDSGAFARLLAGVGIHFVVVVSQPTGAGSFLSYNISYLLSYLQTRTNITRTEVFGPFQVFQDTVAAPLVSVVAPECFDPNSTAFSSSLDLLPSFANATVSDPSVPASLSVEHGTLNLTYNGYTAPINPIYWTNVIPLNISLREYNYLSVTVRSSQPDAWFYVYGNALIGSTVTPFGTTVLLPTNPTEYPASAQPYNAIYASSATNYTLDFSLTNQPLEPYTVPGNLSGSNLTLNYFDLGFRFGEPQPGERGSIMISNITARTYVGSSDALLYMESSRFDPWNESVVMGCVQRPFPQESPEIAWSETNPTSYSVQVRNATSPFDLLLRQSFDPGWGATAAGDEVPSRDHFESDGFANEWTINLTGNFTIRVSYSAQNGYQVMLWVSVAAMAALLGTGMFLIVVDGRRRWRGRSGRP
jgi:hypothetical protein